MITFKTTKLQEMATKSFKGVGNNKLKPLTEMMALKLENGVFTLISTDSDNFLYISDKVETDKDFYAVVQANQFVKLISRLTSENVSLEVKNNCLMITGNGNYKLPVEIDVSTGKMVEYTDPFKKILTSPELNQRLGQLDTTDIATILRALKPSLAIKADIPQYVHYYLGETGLATDTNTASCYRKEISTTPVLVCPQAMDMLGVYAGDEPIVIEQNGNRLLFSGTNFLLVGYAMPGVDNFAVDAINAYVDTAYPYKCKVSKPDLIQALERLSLFVSEYDEDTVDLKFGADDGIELSSKQSDSIEIVPYIEGDKEAIYPCSIYMSMLLSQVKAQTGDTVDICFGDLKSIKLSDDAVTTILCLVV